MTATTQGKARIQYIYNFDQLDAVADGQSSARVSPRKPLSMETPATVGSVVSGNRAHVAVVHAPRGSSTRLQSVAQEQYYFVLQGALTADIDGQLADVSTRHLLHIPANMPHRLGAGSEDADFIAVKDVRECVDGPMFAGFAPGNPVGKTAASPNVSGKKVRYVYAIGELDAVPEGDNSARVTPRNFVSKKSSSFGAAIHGEMLQVGLIHKGRGSGSKLHTHPNEQFNIVLQGKLIVDIDGGTFEAPMMNMIHMPAGVQHCTIASGEGDVMFFVIKDTSHGMAGPPVDGIEDGPRYLPGFRPEQK